MAGQTVRFHVLSVYHLFFFPLDDVPAVQFLLINLQISSHYSSISRT